MKESTNDNLQKNDEKKNTHENSDQYLLYKTETFDNSQHNINYNHPDHEFKLNDLLTQVTYTAITLACTLAIRFMHQWLASINMNDSISNTNHHLHYLQTTSTIAPHTVSPMLTSLSVKSETQTPIHLDFSDI